MATTSNFDSFFQPTSSIADRDRKARKSSNTQGDPIKFSSKLLALEVNRYIDEGGNAIFVTEAGGSLTGLRLASGELSKAPTGPKAPLISIASYGFRDPSNQFTILDIFAGSWDKSIWRYTFQLLADVNSGTTITDISNFPAHTDFVKCLLVANTADRQPVLISGGADGDIRFWSLEGKSLGSLKPQCRGIECLVLDPLSSGDNPIVIFSTSQREIFQFALPALSDIKSSRLQLSQPLVVHETSVYKIYFDQDGDIWTASADKTTKHLVRENGWQPDTTLQHPDFVRDVVVHDRYGLVFTACRDEEIRVWDRGTGNLHHVFSGHFEEVTGLALIGDLLISISIDATLRRWSVAPEDLRTAIAEAKHPNLEEQNPEPQVDMGMLTAEEEAELQALMENEEADTLEKMARDEQ